ncbi:MAG: Gfo/Idh/MocA family oxidoreductase, partial [Chloroflexota bacterium]
MPERLHIAVIGCGYWGPNLARNFHQLPTARLSVVCDADLSRAQALAVFYAEARAVANVADVLGDETIGAVAIATPARTHYELAKRALEHGKHVLVEKPLAMSSADAADLTALAAQRGLTLMVGHTFEYNPAVWKIKELIGAGQIGQLYYIYANRVNLGRVQSDINALWSIAPHDISIILHLLETMPLVVSARGAGYLNDQVEDVVFLTMTFPQKIMAHVQASWLDPSKTRRMTIVGSEKMIVYDDVADEGKVKIYDKGVYRKGDPSYGEFQYRVHSGDIHIPKIDMTEPLANECAHFVACVLTGRTP